MTTRELFLRHVAQTSDAPLAIEIVRAEGCVMWDKEGKRYLDLIGGISVCNTGHRHPSVVAAIHHQVDQYLHLMVYGELVQSPQVGYATALVSKLPPSLDSVYFTNSGAEATEGAMKLAKRATGRTRILSFHQSYHGSTQGALSVMGDEYWRNAYRPLLPGVDHAHFGEMDALAMITDQTAMVIAETIQAERGVFEASTAWMQALRQRCTEMGALLVLDEIQVGFGRTGQLWGFAHYGIVPDILLLGKALGGGMPLGAFVASGSLMKLFSDQPVLGHITTFGGHPVSCAAGMASFEVLFREGILAQVEEKASLFMDLLKHPRIRKVRHKGLLMGIEFESEQQNRKLIDYCLSNGLFTDWFLFAPHCMRIAPPLTITHEEIKEACSIILAACDAC